MIELDLKPDNKKLKQFAWIALFGFGILGLLSYFGIALFGKLSFHQPLGYFLWGLAVLCPILGLINPKLVLPVFLGMSIIAFPIGFVLSFLVIGVLYYLLITPIALFFKIIGRDALKRKLDPEASSYWEEAEQRDAQSYLRQF